MAFISVLQQIFWQKFYWNVSGVVLYQSYEFCPNHWFWLVAVATKRLNFLACNIYSILSEYSLHSCTFRWALWPWASGFSIFLSLALFSGVVRPTKLRHGTHVDHRLVYCVYQNQATAAYLSLYFFIFFSLQFFFLSKISQERLHLGFWNLVQMLGMTCCIV